MKGRRGERHTEERETRRKERIGGEGGGRRR